MSRKSRIAALLYWCVAVLFCLALGDTAFATTYYVGASSTTNALETNPSTPGTLTYAVANAPSGSTVVLENGKYNGTANNGFYPANSGVTYQAQNWHGATIENTTGGSLWTSAGYSSSITNVIAQGIVFGPSTGLAFSGGPAGGSGWEFLDCVFTENGGFEVGKDGLMQNCLFTDDYSNSIDIGATGVNVTNCVIRRSNRSNADSDGTGNKESYSTDLTVNGLVAYDNSGPALWFDTSNDGWTVENSTFFANHGGNNWYLLTINSGSGTTRFTASGQDGVGFSVKQAIMGITGTAANIGAKTVIQSVSGSTITVSPALPAVPQDGDLFAAQQGAVSSGDGFITEANDNGTFTNNTIYSNTDAGYFDHSSGGTTYGGVGGLTVTHNLFAYNGEGFFLWSDARDPGPAKVEYNDFKFLPQSSSAFDSWGSTPGTYPRLGQITFDYNDYNPDNSKGDWATWFSSTPPPTAGGLTSASQPAGQGYLQNPSTWDQDLHSNTNSITFLGSHPTAYIWPAASDTNWSDVYFGNNRFGTSNSIHQINDANGSTSNTIDGAIDGKAVNSVVTIPVSAHTPIVSGVCSVYDLNGRWVKLTVPSANQTAFLAAVPPYVTCTSGNATRTYDIRIRLNSVLPYNVTATYTPSGRGGKGLML